MIIKTGEWGFSHYPNKYMWNGNGERTVVDFIEYDQPFGKEPKIQIGLIGLDSSKDKNLRVTAQITEQNVAGFEVTIKTWADTKLAMARIHWMAIGD